MPFDLESEIARRLNVPLEAVRPVLDNVVERIRQQVTHYGYARLAGLGTFRGQNGDLAFEADPALSEDVNVRFAGLEDVRVGVGEEEGEAEGLPVSFARDAGEDDEEVETGADYAEEFDELPDDDDGHVVYGESPGDDYGRSSEEDAHAAPSWPAEEEPFDDAEPGSFDDAEPEPFDDAEPEPFVDVEPQPFEEAEPEAFDEVETEAFEDVESERFDAADPKEQDREPFPWEKEDVDTEESASGIRWADEEEEFAGEEQLPADADHGWDEPTDESAADESDENDAWLSQPEEDYPLGPPPETRFEEADYSVLDERRAIGHGGAGAGEDEFSGEDDDWFEEDEYGDEDPNVAWSPADEPQSHDLDEEPVFDEEAAMASMAAGGTFDDEEEPELSRSKAPDREARPHERIREHPPRRHSATTTTGGGLAGVNRSALWIGVGVIVIVAAAAVAFFVLSPTEPEQSTVAERTETPAVADTSALAADTAAAVAGDTAAAPAGTAPAPAETGAPEVRESTPLRSDEGIDRSEGGFTIIVYSETSRGNAEDAAARFRNQGFRTSVLEFQENGTTRYRVGVGQFASLDQAAEVRNRLAGGELPDDAWVRRVR